MPFPNHAKYVVNELATAATRTFVPACSACRVIGNAGGGGRACRSRRLSLRLHRKGIPHKGGHLVVQLLALVVYRSTDRISLSNACRPIRKARRAYRSPVLPQKALKYQAARLVELKAAALDRSFSSVINARTVSTHMRWKLVRITRRSLLAPSTLDTITTKSTSLTGDASGALKGIEPRRAL